VGGFTDVWWSENGKNWTRVTENAPSGNACVHNSRIWVLGGGTSDVWWSEDGVKWTKVVRLAPGPSGWLNAGGQWRRVGTTIWHPARDTEGPIPVGEYRIEYKDAGGGPRPAEQTVSVVDGRTTWVTDNYAVPAEPPGPATVKEKDDGKSSKGPSANDSAAGHLEKAELKPFIEKGTRLLRTASADLNDDGTTDYILVLEKQKEKPDDPDIEEGQRPLLILVRDATGALRLVKRNDKIILCSTCGGMFGDAFQGIEAGTKTFTVSHFGGSGGCRWENIYKFNYSRRDKTWQLVATEEFETHPTDGNPDNDYKERKTYTPSKDYGKIDIADFDPENYKGKGER
jgi:hypothetical protein